MCLALRQEADRLNCWLVAAEATTEGEGNPSQPVHVGTTLTAFRDDQEDRVHMNVRCWEAVSLWLEPRTLLVPANQLHEIPDLRAPGLCFCCQPSTLRSLDP